MKLPKPVLATLSFAALSATASAEVLERVVVKVNGDIVTQSEFEARQIQEVQRARITPDRIERFLYDNNARILQAAIDDLLLLQRAAEIGLRIRPESIKEAIEQIKKENKIPNDEVFQEQLSREGMTLDDLRRSIERSILLGQVLSREVESKAAVTEAEVLADYKARKDRDYTQPPTLHLQEILVKSKPDQDATALAREIVTRARGGEDFQALARTYSSSPTRSAGGDLGSLARSELSPQIAKVAASMAVGDISEPFRSGDGFRILKVVDRFEGRVTPFEEAKPDIQRHLAQQRAKSEREKYLEGLRKNAVILPMVKDVPVTISHTAPASTLLEPPAPKAEPAATPSTAGTEPAEVTTTGGTKPERVAPPPPVTGKPEKPEKPEKKEEPRPPQG